MLEFLKITKQLKQINRNLEGEVLFKTENGVFKIPIKCSIKKCDVSGFKNFKQNLKK